MRAKELRQFLRSEFEAHPYFSCFLPESLAVEVDALACFILSCSRAHLIAFPDAELSVEQIQRAKESLSRRLALEPLAYITGYKEFYGINFGIAQGVLIPRPETELLVELALTQISSLAMPIRVIDIGSGSGAIVLAVAYVLNQVSFGQSAQNGLSTPASFKHSSQRKNVFDKSFWEQSVFCGIDISPLAVEVASLNAERLGLSDKVTFSVGEANTALVNIPGDEPLLLLTNPPYIANEAAGSVSHEVLSYEPHIALFGGDDGLDIFRSIVRQLGFLEGRPVFLGAELADDQCGKAVELLSDAGLIGVEIYSDLAGKRRVVGGMNSKFAEIVRE